MDLKSKIGVGADLTIQIVNFRSRHCLEECLFSIAKNMPVGMEAEVVLINNDKEPLAVPASGLNVRAIELNENIGFGRAHNAGFEKSRGKYILFLNPDTKILDGSLGDMLNVFEEYENVGIAGPLLVDSENEIQPDCFGARRTPLSTIREKIFVRKKVQPDRSGETFESDWVSGGAMLVRRDVFEKAGGFDEIFFMYFEDVDLCRRVKKMGYNVVVVPALRILHESGESFASEREKKKHYYASQDYYIRKHFGRLAMWLVKLLRLPYYAKNVWLGR